MTKKIPRAIHSGVLEIRDLSIPCAVLEDGTRVLSETGMVNSLGLYRSGAVHVRARDAAEGDGAHLPLFIAHKNLKPFIDQDLERVLLNPIWYLPAEKGGGRHKGVDAELIPKICDVWLRARDAQVLGKRQQFVAVKADILMRGLAHVGIIALVDEATGYQAARDKKELQKLLAQYISKELLPWAKMFPDEFYRLIFRLKEWDYSRLHTKRPPLVGKITNDIVYERLPAGVIEELRRKNPVIKKGQRRHKHFQFLTDEIGQPHLRNHLIGVIALMRAAPNWSSFRRMLERAYPKEGDQLSLNLPEPESE